MVLPVSSRLGGGDKGYTVIGSVGAVSGNDAPEVVYVIHRIVFNLHQNGSEGFEDGGDFIVGQIEIDCGEYLRGLFEGEGDLFGRRHGGRGRWEGRFVSMFSVISAIYEEEHRGIGGNIISLIYNYSVVA